VLGILTASSATGQLIVLPLAASLIANHGWRYAVLPAFALCLAVAGLAFCLLKDRPEDLGLTAFGTAPGVPAVAVARPRLNFATPIVALAEAARQPAFWVLFGTFFICGLSTSGLIQTHFVSLCGDNGLGAVPAASLLALIGACDFIGTIGSGWLSDRFDNRKLLFWYYGLRGLSLLWLPSSTFSFYGLSFFAVFYGLDWIATVPPTVKLAGSTFGRDRAPMIFGWIFAGHQLGGALAAYGGGLSRTVMFSYSPALYTAGIACLVAACAIFLLRKHGGLAAMQPPRRATA
jgi:predicted MFS family arabinose efflux permease